MAEFRFDVDTSPMAQSIDQVNSNVKVVGTAVTAMQAAVIAAERNATNKICESVDSGFFLLLRSKLSQRIAQFSSIMNSRVGSMAETASSIDNTHKQMQSDFNRIKSRYLKLFDRLDRNLEQRIRELDRHAMEVARQRSSCLNNQQCAAVPAAMYYSTDVSSMGLKLSNARVKVRAQSSIKTLHEGTEQILQYERETRAIFEDQETAQSSTILVPVIYTIVESQAVPNSSSLEIAPPTFLPSHTQAKIATGVRRSQERLRGTSEHEFNTIRTCFVNRVMQEVPDQRVAETMISLFNSSSQTLASPVWATSEKAYSRTRSGR